MNLHSLVVIGTIITFAFVLSTSLFYCCVQHMMSVFCMLKDYIKCIIKQPAISGIATVSFCNYYVINHLSHTG